MGCVVKCGNKTHYIRCKMLNYFKILLFDAFIHFVNNNNISMGSDNIILYNKFINDYKSCIKDINNYFILSQLYVDFLKIVDCVGLNYLIQSPDNNHIYLFSKSKDIYNCIHKLEDNIDTESQYYDKDNVFFFTNLFEQSFLNKNNIYIY